MLFAGVSSCFIFSHQQEFVYPPVTWRQQPGHLESGGGYAKIKDDEDLPKG